MTKGKVRVSCLGFFCRAGFLSSNVISARVFETSEMRFVLNCGIAILNAVSEELVQRTVRNASPLM